MTKQQLFADEYLIDLNGTQAAIRAGYSAKTAQAQSSRLLTNVMVQTAISDAMKAREKRTHITQDRVLQELAHIAFFDIRKIYDNEGNLKRPDQLDDDAAAVLASIDVTELSLSNDNARTFSKKARVYDKLTALTLLMRHLGLLNDKVIHDVEPAGTLSDFIKSLRGSTIQPVKLIK